MRDLKGGVVGFVLADILVVDLTSSISMLVGIDQISLLHTKNRLPNLSVANTTALGHRAHLVPHKPFSGMMRMESMIAVHAEHYKASHQFRFGRRALVLAGIGHHASLRHRIRRSQPETTHSAPRHMTTAFWTHGSRHGRGA